MAKKTQRAPRTTKAKDVAIKGVTTTFIDSGSNVILDGKQIARTAQTFARMWHINTDIRRCIREKQETSMKAGYELHRQNKGDGNERVAEDPDFIEALNKFAPLNSMKDAIIMYLELFGDVYIRKRYNALKQVMGFEIFDTRAVKIVTDNQLNVLKYIYERKTSTSYVYEPYTPEEILHFRTGMNFDNPMFGETIMETLVLDVMGDDEASLVNYFWFQNDALPSAVYILADDMDPDTAEETIEKIRAKLSGGHNKGRDIISTAVKDVKPITQKHNDADFLNLRKFTTERVCVAFGVPRTVLGYVEDVNHSNGDSQYKKFIENTIRPLERKLEYIFTELSKDFKGFRFVINDEHIDNIEQRSKIAVENIKNGLWTINEGRTYIGDYEKFDDDLADELLIPSNIQLLGNLMVGDPTPTDPATLPPAA